MNADEMIAVIAADRDDKPVEWKERGFNEWHRLGENRHCHFNFTRFEYRIKPEPPTPREFWLVKNRDDQFWNFAYRAYDSPQGSQSIYVREVLPPEPMILEENAGQTKAFFTTGEADSHKH